MQHAGRIIVFWQMNMIQLSHVMHCCVVRTSTSRHLPLDRFLVAETNLDVRQKPQTKTNHRARVNSAEFVQQRPLLFHILWISFVVGTSVSKTESNTFMTGLSSRCLILHFHFHRNCNFVRLLFQMRLFRT